MSLFDKLDQLTNVTIQPLFAGKKESVEKVRSLCNCIVFIGRGGEGNSLDMDEHWNHKGKTISYDETNGIPLLHCSNDYITKNLPCHSEKKKGYHASYSES